VVNEHTIEIDGREGEGGGQVLRTALGLSVATGRPFVIHHIRGGRSKPGLLRQHLTCVRAAQQIGAAAVEGATLRSDRLAFAPAGLHAGDYEHMIGSAGSTMLVIQAVLPALLAADGPSRLAVEGGTHNTWSPPFDFVQQVFGPLLTRMGATVDLELVRPGFVPAGGGRVEVYVEPAALAPLELMERGGLVRLSGEALVSALPPKIGKRELTVLRDELGLAREDARLRVVEQPAGPGNVVMVRAEFERCTEVFTAFGRRGLPAERVAADAARQAKRYLDSGVPVGEHLADQLLIPLALAGSGRFRTGLLSLHATTNMAMVERFLPVRFVVEEDDGGVVVAVRGE